MKRNDLLAIVLFSGLALPRTTRAQARPAATRTFQFSAFALLGDRYTGLGGPSGPTFGLGGRNATLTAGADFGLLHTHRTTFAVEVRGSYPLLQGYVDSQKSISGGLRIERKVSASGWSRIHPYVDILAGRGEISYVNGGYPTPATLYLKSSSGVFGGGGGFDLDLSPRWALRGDADFQHWRTPVTTSGIIISKQGSGGIVYRFGTGSKAKGR